MVKASTLRSLVAGVIATWLLMVGTATGSPAQSLTGAEQSKPLIRSLIQEADRSPLKDSVSALAHSMTDLSEAPSDLQLNKMILTLKRSDTKQQALNRYLSELQNPQSAQYHQWISPERFGQLYGADQQDIATITNWLTSHGFTVDAIAPGRNNIIFSGSNAQLSEAFQTTMHQVSDKAGAHHYASLSTPTIPTALAPAVAGFARLNNIPLQPQRADYGKVKFNKSTKLWEEAAVGKVDSLLNVSNNGRTTHAVSPYDWATIYNVTPLWKAGVDGTGQSIAVVAKSDINVDDVASFRKSFGIAAKAVHVVYAGPKPGVTSSEGEAALDAQWSGAIAPQADIYVVTSADTATTDGLYLDFYYAIENNVAPILSVSWGVCELGLSKSENDFISSLWQQAAAQGITVIVSSGDAGSAACDQGSSYALYGMQVNALASTPYNVAVGGTDLPSSYTNPSTYWATKNDPTNMSSALSYIPEIPWNDTCGNPQLLAAYQSLGYSLASAEALCNSSTLGSSVRSTWGGSGGPSHCTDNVFVSSANFTCKSGYSKPGWQAGVVGIPNDQNRDIPDISFFSGGGLWGSYNVYCTSDTSPDGTCDFTNGADVQYMAAGGTSFAAPAFAGVAALLNQKHGGRQGQIAPMLYKLATLQYSTADGLASCDGSAGADGSNCIFHDVSKGSNAVPCYKGYGGCTVSTSGYSYGVLAGYSATSGYDMSSGIGSANVTNLVNKWASATNYYLASVTSLKLDSATIVYGQPAGGTITVAAAAGVTGQPSGDTSILTTGFSNGPFALANGSATIELLGLSAGTHSLTAHYAGSESFAASDSTAVSITVSKAPTTLSMVASRSNVAAGESTTLVANLQTTSTAAALTGAVVFVNKTTGATLGTVTVTDSTTSTVSAQATLTISGAQLVGGANQIVATYAGDDNYAAASQSSVSVNWQAPFTLSANSTLLTVPANGSASINLTLTTNGSALTKDVTFACPQGLPSGLSCAFSPAIAPAGSNTVTTTLTVYSNSSLLTAANQVPTTKDGMPGSATLLLSGLFGLGLLGLRRARWMGMLAIMCAALSAIGCNSNGLHSSVVTLTASANSVALKTPVSYSAVVASNTSTTVPTGQISFYDSGSLLSTVPLASGVASYSTSALKAGNHPITAVYSGDMNYAASSAAVKTDVTYSYNLVITASTSDGVSSSVTMPVTVQ